MRKTLKHRRLTLKIGVRELARRLGVSGGAIIRWENGTRKPTKGHVEAWKKALR